MIVDGHAHLGPREIGEEYATMSPLYTGTELIQSLDSNGIDMALVWAMRQGDDYRKANEYVLRAARMNPKRFVPFVRLNPWYSNSADWLRGVAREGKTRGVKFHPSDECFDADDSIVHPILEVAEREKLLVVFHSGVTARPAMIGFAADRFPNVKMVLAHLGTTLYDDCAFVARKCENVYLETSQCPFLHRIARTMVHRVGVEKLIWGSDVPYHLQEIERRKIELSGLSKDELEMIMGGNICRILNL